MNTWKDDKKYCDLNKSTVQYIIEDFVKMHSQCHDTYISAMAGCVIKLCTSYILSVNIDALFDETNTFKALQKFITSKDMLLQCADFASDCGDQDIYDCLIAVSCIPHKLFNWILANLQEYILHKLMLQNLSTKES